VTLEVLQALEDVDTVFLDTETFSLNPWRDGKVLAGLAVKPYKRDPYYLSVRHPNSTWDVHDLDVIISACRGKTIVMHNAKYDLAVLYQEGWDLSNERVLDTAVLTRLISEDEYNYGLKELGFKYVDNKAKQEEHELKKFLAQMKRDYTKALKEAGVAATEDQVTAEIVDDNGDIVMEPSYGAIPAEVIAPYAQKDVVLTEGLYDIFYPRVESRGLLSLLDLEVKLTRVLFEMERDGARLDRVHVRNQIIELSQHARELERQSEEMVGFAFNMNAAAGVGKAFKSLGYVSHKKTPKGKESWAADALAEIDHPLGDIIRDYRTVTKLVSSYYENFIELCDDDGNLHANFSQSGAKTGRMSVRQPSLQNIPKFGGGAKTSTAKRAKALAALGRKEIDFDDEMREAKEIAEVSESVKRVRASFVPRPGFIYVFCDWSQIELRIFAEYAKELKMLKAFEYGIDIHAVNAAAAFGTLPPEDSKEYEELRSMAKQISFGITYGMGVGLLAATLDCSWDEAQAFMDSYWRMFPKARRFMKAAEQTVIERGWIKNKWQRRRYLSDKFTYKAVNFLVQGSAADLMKETLVEIWEGFKDAGLESRMLMTIHDEVIAEVRIGEEERAIAIITESMRTSKNLETVLRVDPMWSPTSWADKRSLKCDDCDGVGLVFTDMSRALVKELLLDGYIDQVDAAAKETCGRCVGKGYTLEGIQSWLQTQRA